MEENKLIAEFMGYEYLTDEEKMTYLAVPTLARMNKIEKEYIPIMKLGKTIMYECSFEYHNSWDWLMEVVTKIKDSKTLHLSPQLIQVNLKMGLIHVDIERVYDTVVGFIKWHNESQKNENQILGQSTII